MHNVVFALVAIFASAAAADTPRPVNTWTKLDQAALVGRRWDVPLGYAPEQQRFIILGGRSASADYRKPRSYDVLTLSPEERTWQNEFPPGKDWGPKVGACT